MHRLFVQCCSKGSPSARTRCTWGSLSDGDEIISISSKLVRRMTRVDCVKALKGKTSFIWFILFSLFYSYFILILFSVSNFKSLFDRNFQDVCSILKIEKSLGLMAKRVVVYWWTQFLCVCMSKGGIISESFSRWIQSPKKCAQTYPEHLLFRWIELRMVIWHIFGEIAAKVRNFLRVSHQ